MRTKVQSYSLSLMLCRYIRFAGFAGNLVNTASRGDPTSPTARHGTSTASTSIIGRAAARAADTAAFSSVKLSPMAMPSFIDRRLHPVTPDIPEGAGCTKSVSTPRSSMKSRKTLSEASVMLAKARARSAQKMNDSMVYLDGPQIYTCAHCRTHLTSHDDIISKSFHGRHGKSMGCFYLLEYHPSPRIS